MHSETISDHNRLAQEIRGAAYASLLREIQETAPVLKRFVTWNDLIAFMRQGRSDDPIKDQILRPILAAHATTRDSRWCALLLVIFWPGLDAIANRKRKWEPDLEERWQNLLWAFLQTLSKLDPAKRPNRLVQKIINDTFRRFFDKCRPGWEQSMREITTAPDEFERLVAGDENGVNFDGMDLSSTQDLEIDRLIGHLNEGRLCEEDFLLLVATRVFGKSAAQYAHEMGMDQDLARKRRLRAESALRKFETKNKS
ncbi:MAG: hypothetical protein PHV34_14045 [Verrucomicrobiae bacterium]|nr:hypothetical protein [Verrucomicrobiae bacterium]